MDFKDPEKVQVKLTKLSLDEIDSEDARVNKRQTTRQLMLHTTTNRETLERTMLSKDSDVYRLRWVTLGYHYDWNTKEYYRERRSSFPVDLGEMATAILSVCGFPK